MRLDRSERPASDPHVLGGERAPCLDTCLLVAGPVAECEVSSGLREGTWSRISPGALQGESLHSDGNHHFAQMSAAREMAERLGRIREGDDPVHDRPEAPRGER